MSYLHERSPMTRNTKDPIRALPERTQPPLSHFGAAPDSHRARRPALSTPPATGDELNPGNRVEGLGNLGKPTGEFGTVKQANDEDAVVKWDDDGRHRVGQQWLRGFWRPGRAAPNQKTVICKKKKIKHRVR